jgi:hypothetical protein
MSDDATLMEKKSRKIVNKISPYLNEYITAAGENSVLDIITKALLEERAAPTGREAAGGQTSEGSSSMASAREELRREVLEEAAQLAFDMAARCGYKPDHDACDYFGCFDIQRLGESIRALASRPEKGREAVAPPELRKVLEAGLALVESTVVHVSHGGPTRADAEKWIQEARNVLGKS